MTEEKQRCGLVWEKFVGQNSSSFKKRTIQETLVCTDGKTVKHAPSSITLIPVSIRGFLDLSL